MERNNGFLSVIKLFNMFGDLVILNLCFIICCIPIVTIGPALTALYYSIMKLGEEGFPTIKGFFKAFKTDFLKNMLSGLFILVLLVLLFFEGYFLYVTDNLTKWPIILISIVSFWVLSIAAYLFPLNARFTNKFWRSIRNALLLSITNFPKTILMVAINICQIPLYIWQQELLGKIFILALAFSFSAPVYFDSLILKKIFRPFLESDTSTENKD